jgi:hypothetical protein
MGPSWIGCENSRNKPENTMDTVKERLFAFIQRHELAVMATASGAAVPEAALVNIAVTPALEIVFETTAATRKHANLRDNPHVAMVVGWKDDQTLQIDGIAEMLEGASRDRLRKVFMAAFPEKAFHAYWPGNDFYCVRPYWARFSNYSPPRKVEEFSFPENDIVPVVQRWWPFALSPRRKRRQRN